MREISYLKAKEVFNKYNVLKNVKNTLDVGGARKVWLELESPPKDKRLLRILRYKI